MLSNKLDRQKISIVCGFAACVVFLCIIMSCVPLASDDVEFSALKLSGVKDLLRYILQYGNGRFLGNLGAICLSRMPWLAVIIKALLLSGIIFLLPTVLNVRSGTGYLLSFLLFITVRPSMFGQIYTWTSGFQNYVPPIWTTLMILYLIQKLDAADGKWKKRLLYCLIFVLGVSGQLFVEHCSVLNVLLAGICAADRKRRSKSPLPALIWLAASLAGLAVMFAIPKLFFVEANRSEGYRSVNTTDLPGLIDAALSLLWKFCTMFYPLSCLVISPLVALSTYHTRNSRSSKWNSLLYGICLFITLFYIANLILIQNAWYAGSQALGQRITSLIGILPFLLWPVALAPATDRGLWKRICLLLVLGACSLVPFLVVSPSPTRVFFFAYVCVIAAIVQFFEYVRLPGIKRVLSVGIAVMCLQLLLSFANISWISSLRETHIRQEMEAGKTEIVIFKDPYAYVHWSGTGCYGLRYYYEKENDITFTSTDFTTWYNTVWLKKNGN